VPTILVADDNSNIQKMVTLAFKEEGISVVAVGNGEAAVRKAAEILPDLVLADIFMPVRNGYEVCEYIKQNAKLAHIPVVLLVGAFDPFNEREAQRVSADGVLKKPFVPPDPLVGIVKSLLAKALAARPVPVAVSVPEPVLAAVVQPARFSTAQVSDDSPDPDEEEIEEAALPKDFSLLPPQIDSSHEGGADAFSAMLDTGPLGTKKPSQEAPVEKDHSQEAQAPAHSPGVSAPNPGFAAGAENASAGTEEKSSAEDSAQFPPLRTQMVRDWGVHSPLPENSDEESDAEPAQRANSPIGMSSAVDDWRASFPVSGSQEAQIFSTSVPNAPSLSPWRDFGISAEQDAVTFTDEEPSPTGAAVAEQDSSRIAEPVAEPEHEVNSPVDVNPSSDTAFHAEPTPSIETSSRVGDLKSSFAQAEEQKTQISDLPEMLPPSWPHIHGSSAHTSEHADSEAVSDVPAGTSGYVAADLAGDKAKPYSEAPWDSKTILHSEADSVPAPVALPLPETGHALNFAGTSEAIEGAPADIHAAQAEPEQDKSAPAESGPTELLTGAGNEGTAESFSVPAPEAADPRVVEEIVARVVERMQPQILEIVTREVLRPVVEALVRRQLDQK
jgi:CheY-like chemotaxis protein